MLGVEKVCCLFFLFVCSFVQKGEEEIIPVKDKVKASKCKQGSPRNCEENLTPVEEKRIENWARKASDYNQI